MPDLDQIDKAHQAWIDSILEQFVAHLNAIVSGAKARLQAKLHNALTFNANGDLQRTVSNSTVLKKSDAWFMREMDAGGYEHLLREFTQQFPGQLQFFQQTLEYLSDGLKEPLPKIDWSATDLRAFMDFEVTTRAALDAVMETVATTARGRVLLSLGGLKFPDLVSALAEAFDKGVPQVASMAETATATFYRVIANQGYQKLDAGFPGVISYKFYGPADKLNRPFCRHLLVQCAAGKSFTRPQIDEMDNGQIPNVFLSGGGFRCRHQWIVAVPAEMLKATA